MLQDRPCKLQDLQAGIDQLHRHTSQELEFLAYGVKQQTSLLQIHKRTLQEQIRIVRSTELLQRKKLRQQERCNSVKQKIAQLNKRDKQVSVRTAKSIEYKLAELNAKKRQYCSAAQH